ncbi:hypothetical protein X994_6510 (plasmid) [Burkholderia pseudomallei]|uniref:Uncharacterized protein n=1 Tax=Burkholderia pseudomallei TaxID=28450 RepID=A0AA40MH12_BURPE|nr:hypothetical protein [Burkholderia pseudomallei]AIV73845.1 hypothetical protein X994_6510 [Burkholderia pseudomallei]KGS74157.1 hypothetical protein X942_5545 [Burkholderia pseudomallei MSHR5596]KGW80314.1 hypothetical protein Y046_6309 [Burkholderia pseudomallei MSHR2990]KGX17055.1 hypothetical protein Y036_6148 [Burkholderia pseudomallei]
MDETKAEQDAMQPTRRRRYSKEFKEKVTLAPVGRERLCAVAARMAALIRIDAI